ncbi:MAG: class I SAM-dependent methyltransferase [Oscillochloris sp.]|nr:class I SAM-dependent methyltransferase [Oscillochloris sp.]
MSVTAQETGIGGIDWGAYWQQMHDAEGAQSEAVLAAGVDSAPDRWAGQAGRYAAATGRVAQPDAFMQFVLPHLRPDDRVLDIGAGAGRHAGFLAGHVAQVIAVERSPAMRMQLERRIAEQQIPNIAVVAADWPAAAVAEIDIAICSHVIYGVRTIVPFLQHMDAVARRACFISAGFRQPSYGLNRFWQHIYGEARLPLPGAMECLNVLDQLGIRAQLNHIPASYYSFADETEALADIRWRLRLSQSPQHDAAILAAIADILVRDAAGRLARPISRPTPQ